MKRWVIIALIIGVLIMANIQKAKANPNVAANVEKFRELTRKYTTLYGLPENLMLALIAVESGGNPEAKSVSNALGLTQILPSTLPDINQMLGTSYGPFDLFIPEVSIQCGTAYINWLVGQFDGNLALAVRAYNQGIGNIEKNQFRGQDYLNRVSVYYDYLNGSITA